MTGKETFRIPSCYEWQKGKVAGIWMLRMLRSGVKYQQIMSDPDRRDALDPESLKELRKVTDILREL